ncbi:MAG: insulinase family protein [Firmicutes bacterium]|nr:insulinase family protein [Bacillota bacterium]MCL5040644.1 insulinase family protein [Bacillota bacterium]
MEVLTNPILKEAVYSQVLPSGLKVFVLPRPGYNKKYATFATHYGSVDSHFVVPDTGVDLQVPDGIAHFLEHKMFEEEFGNIFDRFAKLGASANAYTEYVATTYLFSATDNFEASLEVLLDFVQRPYFTDENVEKEKGIIEQEIRMYRDMPRWRVQENLLEALYHVHPVRINIAGSVESIYRINKDLLYQCYRTFYHPSNMVFLAVGDLDPERVIQQVADNQARKGFSPQSQIKRLYPEEPPSVRQREIVEEMVVSRPMLNLGFKDNATGYAGRRLLEKEVAVTTALEALLGKSSELYSRIYQEGLIDEGFGYEYMAERDYAAVIIGGETRDPQRLKDLLLEGIQQAQQQGVNEAAFERQRRKAVGGLISLFNSPENLAYQFNHFYFRETSLFDYQEVLEKLGPEDVNRSLREHLSPENLAVSVIKPKKTGV